MQVRALTRADVAAIHALEASAYDPALHESPEAFARLIDLYPDGALGAFDAHGLCGYILGVPLPSGMTLELRVPLAAIPADADVFYIHDIAVDARCRRRGLGAELAGRMLAVARAKGFTRAELVSVQGSAPFWARFGFRPLRAFEYAPGAPSVQMAAAL